MKNVTNKAIINKVDNVTRVDFSKREIKNINCKNIGTLKKKLEYQQKKISIQIKITQNILEQNVKHILKNTDYVDPDTIKKQLFHEKFSAIWLEWLPQIQFPLPLDNNINYELQPLDTKVQDESEKTLKFFQKLEQILIDPESKIQLEYDYKKQEIDNHCNNIIPYLKNELKHTNETLELIQDILYNIENLKGLATPNDVRIASIGTKQTLKWLDVDDNHKEKVKELLKSTAPEILQKLEDDDNSNEIISHFIGIKLTKTESRILKTLRALVDRAFKLREIQSYSHKVRITRADFYKEYGLKSRLCGGYEDNQTKKIREVLFSGNSNLTKRIFFKNSKNKTVLVTAFILKIEWEEEQNNYFDVMLDDIIFVKDKSDKYSYYYEDLQGLNRLIELMPNSDIAFDIHGYLEYSLKLNVQEFGITKIINASDSLLKRYQKDKKGTDYRIEKVLDNMIKAKTLISKWKKLIGKNETKYSLTNIRQKEISNEIVAIKNKKNKK